MKRILPALAIAAISQPAWAGAPPEAHLGDLKVRLWYLNTGRLSDNFDESQRYAFWNTVIGGGATGEPADDALFTVDVRAAREQFFKARLTLTATDEKGRILARRVFANVATGEQGNMTAPLWVKDISCAGPVTFRADLLTEHKTVTLNFNCGE